MELEGGGVISVPHGDKVIHVAVYYLLTWLGGRHWHATGRPLSMVALLAWAVVFAVYGVLDEWLQQYTGRSMGFDDWLADLVGIASATTVLALRRRSRGLSEPGPEAL